jgi:hypothetical protein
MGRRIVSDDCWGLIIDVQDFFLSKVIIVAVMLVTSAEELYRQLARDFHFMARSLPSGENRSAYLNAAEEWERRADQEGGALALKKLEHSTRGFPTPAKLDVTKVSAK